MLIKNKIEIINNKNKNIYKNKNRYKYVDSLYQRT